MQKKEQKDAEGMVKKKKRTLTHVDYESGRLVVWSTDQSRG